MSEPIVTNPTGAYGLPTDIGEQPNSQDRRGYSALSSIWGRGKLITDAADRWRMYPDGVQYYGDGVVTPQQHAMPELLPANDLWLGPTQGFFATNPVGLANGTTLASQSLRLTYFIAPATITINSFRTIVTGFSAVVGQTYAGWGVYEEDSSGNLTLIAKIEDTGAPPTYLGSAAVFNQAFNVPINFVRGRRYASGPLTVYTSATTFQMVGGSIFFGDAGNMRTELILSGPNVKRAAVLAGQSVLPASITNAAILAGGGSGQTFAGRFIP